MFSSDLSQESSQFLILDTSEGELTRSLPICFYIQSLIQIAKNSEAGRISQGTFTACSLTIPLNPGEGKKKKGVVQGHSGSCQQD